MISCHYSEIISASAASYSPSGLLLGTVLGIKVTIRDSKSLKIVQTFQCIDRPDKIEFSPDSSYLLCAFLSRGAIQCFAITDPDWKCRINEGVSGFINVFWMPDSRGIVTISDFGIQVSVWSLLDSTCQIISSPKQGLGLIGSNGASQQQLLAFSDCSRYLAIVHRLDLHDYIGVYSTNPFQELSKFKSKSNDIAAVYWTPNSTHIITVDSPLTYRIVVFTASGEVVASYEAYVHALGIRSIDFYRFSTPVQKEESVFADSFSSSQILSVGSYDGKVRLLSMKSWQAAFVLPLVHPRDMDISLYEEPTPSGSGPSAPHFLITLEVPLGADGEAGDVSTSLGLSTISGQPVSGTFDTVSRRAAHGTDPIGNRTYITRRANTIKSLPRMPVDPRNPKFLPPQQGVSWHGRSHCGSLLAARESSHPRCLWIWSTLEAKLQSIIVQLDPIVCAAWRPTMSQGERGEGEGERVVEGEKKGEERGEEEGEEDREQRDNETFDSHNSQSFSSKSPLLAFCTGTGRLYFWSKKEGKKEGVIRWSDTMPPSSSTSISTSLDTSIISTVTFGNKIDAGAVSTLKTMSAISLEWSKDGKFILLKGKEIFLICDVPTH